MALSALGIFLQHPFSMGVAVACSAWRYHLVCITVTKGTGKIMVLGRILFQQVRRFLMTRPTIVRRCLLAIGNNHGHMDRMTGQARLRIHVLCMLFMASHAVRNLPVGYVAFVACHIRVGTRVVFDLITLLLVTCEAGSGDVAFERQIQGGMGVGVTARAVLKFIMRGSAVAKAASGYCIRSLGRMLSVTVQTAHLCLMFVAVGFYRLRLLLVAQNTMSIGQSRDFQAGCRRRGPHNGSFFTTKSAKQSDHSGDNNNTSHRSDCTRRIGQCWSSLSFHSTHTFFPPLC